MKRYLLACSALIFLAACSSDRQEPRLPEGVPDDLHRIVRLPAPPKRIVSLAPSLTETLFALGLDSSVVGVTDYCNYPPQAARRPHVGGITNPNLERIVALKPDLVVMTVEGNSRSDFVKLEKLGLKVYVSNPRRLGDVFRTIRSIAHLTRTSSRADSLISSLERRRLALMQRASADPPMPVLFLVSLRPMISAGHGTFVDEIIRLANGLNVAASSRIAYPMLSAEQVLRSDPYWIITTTDVAQTPDRAARSLVHLRSLRAVRERHIIILDADLISRPGPRLLDGLEELVQAMHGKPGPAPARSDPASILWLYLRFR